MRFFKGRRVFSKTGTPKLRTVHANLGQVMIVIVERLRAYVAEADSGVNILIVFRRSGSGDT